MNKDYELTQRCSSLSREIRTSGRDFILNWNQFLISHQSGINPADGGTVDDPGSTGRSGIKHSDQQRSTKESQILCENFLDQTPHLHGSVGITVLVFRRVLIRRAFSLFQLDSNSSSAFSAL